jgi:hypothetical protein
MNYLLTKEDIQLDTLIAQMLQRAGLAQFEFHNISADSQSYTRVAYVRSDLNFLEMVLCINAAIELQKYMRLTGLQQVDGDWRVVIRVDLPAAREWGAL